ncbi:DUF1810 domain-containing protein [Dyadobacter chenwenxiniae]|uniref:DUF1810 domain-containing protein n=1 Tax=Dyadobacter chenwenxiniae TaxID=2906456 RepID=A0A9X1PPG9_9BACT|nr:DUF1810 domain-containing protein [Dyadobacter chenwenxiniae]MCF0063303.1 DUF1810 domain-containing protein [Dyadobacter chenwenxiniae]UON85318.1 DUF1810 domain-containing protein [Dyadobacter chenwenxiniae]
MDSDLDKFLTAQEGDYAGALAEMKRGRKQGHWIWYIFPQITGLGMSSTSVYYAIADMEQANRYFQHPVLGRRLVEISNVILAVESKTANQIMGTPDDLKLRSSMTLFSMIENADPVFQEVLNKYFNGNPDQKTIEILNK